MDGLYKKLSVSFNNSKDYLECIDHLGPTQNAELVEATCLALHNETGKLLEAYRELHAYRVSKEKENPPNKL